MTGMYDEEVRPFGVQASQVSLLAMIAAHGPVRRSDLGRWLHFDSSTLTRNLRIMLAKSWIEEVADATDGRGLPLQVTAAGTGLLEAIGPAWDRAQSRAADLMGGEGRTAIMGLFDKVRQSVRA
jgi:DNA-binding MarR family transcriptional regulator